MPAFSVVYGVGSVHTSNAWCLRRLRFDSYNLSQGSAKSSLVLGYAANSITSAQAKTASAGIH